MNNKTDLIHIDSDFIRKNQEIKLIAQLPSRLSNENKLQYANGIDYQIKVSQFQ
jgi:hypothetical protein